MGLDRFLSEKEISIDDAGWGDLILGVVVGALKLPDHRYMERRIPVSSFQPPNFKDKQYLEDAVKIAEEIVEVMRPDSETRFRVCSICSLEHSQALARAGIQCGRSGNHR